MTRAEFLLSSLPLFILPDMDTGNPTPDTYLFADDGQIPNSLYPLLLYRNAFAARGTAGASWLETRFADNNWTNSWRNGVFPYLHYHSISHEVLGVYSGSAKLQLGGKQGKTVSVQAGDVFIIPAGVGHQNLGSSTDFGVVGAYPDGRTFDVLRVNPASGLERIKRLPLCPYQLQTRYWENQVDCYTCGSNSCSQTILLKATLLVGAQFFLKCPEYIPLYFSSHYILKITKINNKIVIKVGKWG